MPETSNESSRSVKAGVLFGVGLVALECANVTLQLTDTIHEGGFENIIGLTFALGGVWRIVEPSILMRTIDRTQ